MNILHPSKDYLKFVVDGCLNLYSVNDAGAYYLLGCIKPFYLLGMTEFCGESESPRYHEVVQTVKTIEIPLNTCRAGLMEDNRFLRYLLKRMAAAMERLKYSAEDHTTLEDVLLFYIRHECPGQILSNVENTAFRLNYSRRQMHRVLRDLTDRGILKRLGNGKYQLVRVAR